jgi:hypothetical protein
MNMQPYISSRSFSRLTANQMLQKQLAQAKRFKVDRKTSTKTKSRSPDYAVAAALAGNLNLHARCGRQQAATGALVHFRREQLAAGTLVLALDGGSMLALALGGGLFEKLACAQLGQQAQFFNTTLKAAQRNFKGLVFFQADGRHILDKFSEKDWEAKSKNRATTEISRALETTEESALKALDAIL